uniref:Uncharacterized protein n=1 Tax=Acrobeloides nanus TaxID=290746 RepID=A0A914DB10_9BILA
MPLTKNEKKRLLGLFDDNHESYVKEEEDIKEYARNKNRQKSSKVLNNGNIFPAFVKSSIEESQQMFPIKQEPKDNEIFEYIESQKCASSNVPFNQVKKETEEFEYLTKPEKATNSKCEDFLCYSEEAFGGSIEEQKDMVEYDEFILNASTSESLHTKTFHTAPQGCIPFGFYSGIVPHPTSLLQSTSFNRIVIDIPIDFPGIEASKLGSEFYYCSFCETHLRLTSQNDTRKRSPYFVISRHIKTFKHKKALGVKDMDTKRTFTIDSAVLNKYPFIKKTVKGFYCEICNKEMQWYTTTDPRDRIKRHLRSNYHKIRNGNMDQAQNQGVKMNFSNKNIEFL